MELYNYYEESVRGEGIAYYHSRILGKMYKTIKYKGNFENGMYHGHGILYHEPTIKDHYEKENIKYEGEFLNGLYHGKGTLYSFFGKRLYDGEQNKDFYIKKIYEGDFCKGLYHGKGITYDYCGNIKYEGDYVKGKSEGFGKIYIPGIYKNIEFEGEFVDNKYHGIGTQYLYRDDDEGPIKVIGEYSNDKEIGLHILFDDNLVLQNQMYNNGMKTHEIYYYRNGTQSILFGYRDDEKRDSYYLPLGFIDNSKIVFEYLGRIPNICKSCCTFYKKNGMKKYYVIYRESKIYRKALYSYNGYKKYIFEKLFYKNKIIIFF